MDNAFNKIELNSAMVENLPVTLISVFTYSKKFCPWAMSQMYLAKKPFDQTPALLFYKLLGTAHGFSFKRPNLRRWVLLTHWPDAESLDYFKSNHWVYQKMCSRSHTREEFLLQPYQSKGSWNGKTPFAQTAGKPAVEDQIAVLTRGSIRLFQLINFWINEPAISRSLSQAPGLVESLGMGELPIFRQVTFSIWKNEAAMESFASGNTAHGKAAKKAEEHHYFQEAMFTRFTIKNISGSR